MRGLLKNKLVHHDSSKYDGYRLTPLVRVGRSTRRRRLSRGVCATDAACACGATSLPRACGQRPRTQRVPQRGAAHAPSSTHVWRAAPAAAHLHALTPARTLAVRARQGYDFLAIHALVSRGALAAIGRKIGVGKESDVYEASVLRLRRAWTPRALPDSLRGVLTRVTRHGARR